eukprot:evm.model.scf_64.7 EVM.evm.TU.scf_64.7   scf_64:63979-68538(-)
MKKHWNKLAHESGEDDTDVGHLVRQLGSPLRSRRERALAGLAGIADDPANQLIMAQGGAVRTLAKAVSREEGEAQCHALRSLSCLASGQGQIRGEMIDVGIVNAMAGLLRGVDAQARTCAAEVLANLSCEDRGKEAIIRTGIGAVLAQSVSSGQAPIEESALRLVGNLLIYNPGFAVEIADAGLVGRLVKVMQVGKGLSRRWAARVLALLLEGSDERRDQVIAAGGVGALLAAVLLIGQDWERAEWAMQSLACVAGCRAGRAAIIEARGVPNIVRTLSSNVGGCRDSAARALAYMALVDDAENMKHMEEGIPALVAMVQSGAEGVKKSAIAALGNMARSGAAAQEAVAKGGAVQPMVWGLASTDAAMRSTMLGSLDAVTRENAANMLEAFQGGAIPPLIRILGDEGAAPLHSQVLTLLAGMLSHCPDARPAFTLAGGFDAVIRFLPMGNPDKCGPAMRLLSVLAESEELQAALVAYDALPIVSRGIRSGDAGVQASALALLAAVARCADGSDSSFLSSEDVRTVVELTRSQSDVTCRQAAATLAGLSSCSLIYKSQVAACGAVPALVDLLASGCVECMGQAARALGALASGSSDNQAVIGEAGAVPPLVFILGIGSPECAEAGVTALAELVRGSSPNLTRLAEQRAAGTLASLLAAGAPGCQDKAAYLLALLSRSVAADSDDSLTAGVITDMLTHLQGMLVSGGHEREALGLRALQDFVCSSRASEELHVRPIIGAVGMLLVSEDKAVREEAREVLERLAQRSRDLPLEDVEVPLLVPFIRNGSPFVCEKALDALTEMVRKGDPSKEGETIIRNHGVAALVRVLTFGTEACKVKCARVMEMLVRGCEAAQARLVQEGAIRPLVHMLAVEGEESQASARGVLSILTGKDVGAMSPEERSTVVMELLTARRAARGGGSAEGLAVRARAMQRAGSMGVADSDVGSTGEEDEDSLLSPVSTASGSRLRMRDLPDLVLCPITQEVMTDPVIAADGHTYEKAAILSWFSKHTTSPMTNEELPSLNVIPNQTVVQLISNLRPGLGAPS